jgi:hypothetical protein
MVWKAVWLFGFLPKIVWESTGESIYDWFNDYKKFVAATPEEQEKIIAKKIEYYECSVERAQKFNKDKENTIKNYCK